jgi:hypothetical protein
MAEIVHLGERDYDDEAVRRDWQKQGFATVPEFGGHPVGVHCPACSGPDLLTGMIEERPPSWPPREGESGA